MADTPTRSPADYRELTRRDWHELLKNPDRTWAETRRLRGPYFIDQITAERYAFLYLAESQRRGREMARLNQHIHKLNAKIRRLRAALSDRPAPREQEPLLAFVRKIAEMKTCDDEPERCGYGSGPYCSTHGDRLVDDEIAEARKLLREQEKAEP